MIFGDTPLGEAEGAILAHSVKLGPVRFKKGRVLSADDLAALEKAGVTTGVAAVATTNSAGPICSACTKNPAISPGTSGFTYVTTTSSTFRSTAPFGLRITA